MVPSNVKKKKKGTTKCDKITVICDLSTTVLKTGPDRPVRPVQPGTGSQSGPVKTPKTGQKPEKTRVEPKI